MRVHNVYSDEMGETHFRDIEIEWISERLSSKFSELFRTKGMEFRRTDGDYNYDWHPAPKRQFVINLDAGVEVTVSDGESRVIGAGEVLLVEDIDGKGHRSRAVNGQARHCIFIPLD
ncbi:MAG: hypothetical protein MK031_09740 [Alphaproteobacteria bacterium]|nr:hypothetical protein [Alphaproteobacteria bacterium]|tara:strand:- start:661 stop:1011 length:351 start_codon:yes stop_codon:yes gene_type:complete